MPADDHAPHGCSFCHGESLLDDIRESGLQRDPMEVVGGGSEDILRVVENVDRCIMGALPNRSVVLGLIALARSDYRELTGS